MSRETLKHEIDILSESQLARIVAFVDVVKSQAQTSLKAMPFWQSASPADRSREFRIWTAGLPKVSISLSDEAFNRESIYE